MVRLARISGQASASVAPSSARQAPECGWRGCPIHAVRLAAWRRRYRYPVENPWAAPIFCSSARLPKENGMRFVKAVWKLLVGIKDVLVLLFMLMFFGLLYAGLSARPAGDRRRRAGDGPRRRAGRAGGAPRPVRRVGRRRQRHPRIRAQGPRRRARHSQGRRAGSRRSRSTSTASSAAASRPSPRSAKRSAR